MRVAGRNPRPSRIERILCTISAAYERGAVPICNSFASLQRLADFEGKAAQHAN
jgi:hypothetical protein